MEVVANYMVFAEASQGIMIHIIDLRHTMHQTICGIDSRFFSYPPFRYYKNEKICKRCLKVARKIHYADVKEKED